MPDLELMLEEPTLLSGLDPVSYQYFNQMLNNRRIIMNGNIDETLLETVLIPLLDFEKDSETVKPVELLINCVGGEVANGLYLLNVIDNYKKPLVITVCGYAYSLAAIIMCAGSKNPLVKKRAYRFSTFLFHSGNISINSTSTAARDILDFQNSVDNDIRQYILDNTKISAEQYDSHYRKEWCLLARDCLDFGIIDEIIG